MRNVLDVVSYRKLSLSPAWIRQLDKVSTIPGIVKVYPGGSRYIGGSNHDSDWDIVVLADETSLLEQAGFTAQDTDTPYEGHVRSYRKGLINLIVHYDEVMYLRTIAATELCRANAVHIKEQRYEAHEIIKGEHA